MNATKAREYLTSAAATEVGREYLERLGFQAVISQPDRGDDESTITIAELLKSALHQSYPGLF